MLVPDDVRKCVAFLGYRRVDSSFRFAGSAFFLGRDDGADKADPMYAVTARHVIDGIRSKGLTQVWFRLNLTDGSSSWFHSPIDSWFSHPSDDTLDVAIYKMGLPQTFDHLVYPYSRCINDQVFKSQSVSLGDEVFITGLFRHRHGTLRNIPIVRIGNLACMTEERVVTRDFGEIDAYLVEARSIGGLSGSPVFLNLGLIRLIEKSQVCL